jgi:hypothetical protein
LSPRDGAHGTLLDHALQLIDLGVGVDDTRAERSISADQRIDRLHDLPLGETAHLGNQPRQFLQIVVESPGGVFESHVDSPRACARNVSRSGL